jgi:hypothetical protein
MRRANKGEWSGMNDPQFLLSVAIQIFPYIDEDV